MTVLYYMFYNINKQYLYKYYLKYIIFDFSIRVARYTHGAWFFFSDDSQESRLKTAASCFVSPGCQDSPVWWLLYSFGPELGKWVSLYCPCFRCVSSEDRREWASNSFSPWCTQVGNINSFKCDLSSENKVLCKYCLSELRAPAERQTDRE